MFICKIWLFVWYFPQFLDLICRSADISKCFRGYLRLRDNESRLYFSIAEKSLKAFRVRLDPFQSARSC